MKSAAEKESEEAPHIRVAKKEDAKLWDILMGPKEPQKIKMFQIWFDENGELAFESQNLKPSEIILMSERMKKIANDLKGLFE